VTLKKHKASYIWVHLNAVPLNNCRKKFQIQFQALELRQNQHLQQD